MSCRQAIENTERTINAENTENAEKVSLLCDLCDLCVDCRFCDLLVIDDGHLARSQCFEETSGGVEIELAVSRLDAEKEAVPARERKPRYVENGVIGHRQAVDCQEAEHRGE